MGKIYLRSGNAGLDGVDPAYRFAYLSKVVDSIPTYDFANKYGYDLLYQNCTNSRFSKLVCSLNYSYLSLVGEFGTMFKQLFEKRYTTDLN